MKILVLSPYPENLSVELKRFGNLVEATSEPLRDIPTADFVISYGYRHIIREPILSAFRNNIINLHISLLPWNRGSDPNFWSWHDDTPKGVTIHHIDAGLDTGDIIAQEVVDFSDYPDETLATSYHRLQCAVEILFKKTWPEIRMGKSTRTKQTGRGSYHRASDKNDVWGLFPLGFDSPVSEIRHKLLPRETDSMTSRQ